MPIQFAIEGTNADEAATALLEIPGIATVVGIIGEKHLSLDGATVEQIKKKEIRAINRPDRS